MVKEKTPKREPIFSEFRVRNYFNQTFRVPARGLNLFKIRLKEVIYRAISEFL